MSKSDPSRDELIREVVDVIGNIKPVPSKKAQFGSMALSFAIRLAAVAYSSYLGFLFSENLKAFQESPEFKSGVWDWVLLVALMVFALYIVFQKVYGDRLVSPKEMVSKLLPRGLVIVATFLFWKVTFDLFPGLGNSIMSFVAFYFIVGSGYGFRLSGRRSPLKDQF